MTSQYKKYKDKKTETLKAKTTIKERNSLYGLYSWMEMTEEQASVLEDRLISSIQSENLR